MTALLVVLVALLVLLVLLAIMAGKRAQMPRSFTGEAHREAAMEAQAEVEAGDIDQMLAARNALRARIGKPSLGDELADEVRREPDAP